MRKVVVVCGYGCHLVPELKRYLEKVGQFLWENFCSDNVINQIILCGGYTQRKSAPGMSEAQLMWNYLISSGLLTPKSKLAPIIELEDDSYTTFENIKKAAVIIGAATEESGDPDAVKNTHIFIFCEAQRALKVAILAHYFLKEYWGRIIIKTVSWELRDPVKELKTTILDLLAIYIPWLAKYARKKRLRRAEQI